MKYKVIHRTQYRYIDPINLSHNEARLSPRNFNRQTCVNRHLKVDPYPSGMWERADFFGNLVSYFAVQHVHKQMIVSVTSEIQTERQAWNADSLEGVTWESVFERLKESKSREALDARQFALNSPLVDVSPELRAYAKESFLKGRPIFDAVQNLMRRIYKDFSYVPGYTTVSTPLSEVMMDRKGVCQDFAHLAIGCVRVFGLPARYVSGYMETRPPPGKKRLVGADASHAWFSVFMPDQGWIDFDPTNNQLTDERYITLAWGRDFSDVSPLRGVIFGSGKHKLIVSVDVERVEN